MIIDTEEQRVLEFIKLVRESHPSMVEIFTRGSCLNFGLILEFVFPSALKFYDTNHVISNIGDKFYDITGRVEPKKWHDIMINMYNQEGFERVFNQMYNAVPVIRCDKCKKI